jgi:hypothetical protein
MADAPRRDIYFEHTVIGGSVKVVAIDSVTAVEVAIVGPTHAARSDLERVALRKLLARLAREADGQG